MESDQKLILEKQIENLKNQINSLQSEKDEYPYLVLV